MRKLFNYFLLGLLSFISSIACAQTINDPGPVVKKYITEYMQQKNVQGVAVALYYQGKPYFYNFGYARPGVAVTSNTLFPLASITKVFTSTLFALDVLDGTAHLNDKLVDYLHNDALKKRPAGQITLEQLGSYTSSLPESIPQKSLTDIESFLMTWQPEYPIGTHYIYSNLGMALLGYAASQAAHHPYKEYLQQDIFNPLKMRNTGLGTPDQGLQPAALGYDKNGRQLPYWMGAPFSEPAGQIYSNAIDMMQFLKANLGIPGTGASPRLLQAMHFVQQPRFHVSPRISLGLGWGQLKLPNSQMAVNKNGAIRGFGTFITMVPKKKMGIVILGNINGSPAVNEGLAIMNTLSAK